MTRTPTRVSSSPGATRWTRRKSGSPTSSCIQKGEGDAEVAELHDTMEATDAREAKTHAEAPEPQRTGSDAMWVQPRGCGLFARSLPGRPSVHGPSAVGLWGEGRGYVIRLFERGKGPRHLRGASYDA